MSSRILAGLVMFLTFFGWGVFFVPMGPYLAKAFPDDTTVIGIAYGMGPLAAMISPLVAGWLADRAFSPRKLLAGLAAVAGGLLFLLPSAGTAREFQVGLFIHSLAFFAALPLLNAVVMASLADPGREFGSIRLWGTIGWIVSGVAIGSLLPLCLGSDVATQPVIFQLGGGALILMSLAAIRLADPAPKEASAETAAPGGVGRLLGDPKFLLFLVFSVLFCIPLALYYSYANSFLKSAGIGQTETFMTAGQVSEVVFLALLPLLATRLTAKTILLIGMACWALRYWLFAEFPSSGAALFVAIALHGACYDFFFVTGTLYADRKAPEGLRNTAQSVVAWATLGLGLFIGNLLAPVLHARFIAAGPDGAMVFAREFWLTPSLFALGLLVVFALVFRDDTRLSDAKA
jgi:nucleoside transporter